MDKVVGHVLEVLACERVVLDGASAIVDGILAIVQSDSP
jgi:hypothetical protein